ncbi:MAG TPA: DUF721 domain-containing protein [Burkholderiales bacterium]
MSLGSAKGWGLRPLSACLPAHLAAAISARVDEFSRLQQAWRTHVPEPLASHARPVRYAAGLLFVHADTPAWASRLRHERSAVIAALRRTNELRGLSDLQVRAVPREAAPAPMPPPRRGSSRLSPRAARIIGEAARGIADPKLRAALERLAAAREAAPEKP